MASKANILGAATPTRLSSGAAVPPQDAGSKSVTCFLRPSTLKKDADPPAGPGASGVAVQLPVTAAGAAPPNTRSITFTCTQHSYQFWMHTHLNLQNTHAQTLTLHFAHRYRVFLRINSVYFVFWVIAPCIWFHYISLHGATTQRTAIFIFISVRTSNPTQPLLP
jgi:hypothetical protein